MQQTRKFNQNLPIILVSAKQGAGRKTVLEGLRSILAKESVTLYPIKFAAPLYAMQDAVLNVARSDLRVPVPEKDGPLLQMLGHEWLRTYYGANVIAAYARRQVDAWLNIQESSMFPAACILPDCHYIEEFEAFPDAIRVRLECDRDTRKERTPVAQWRTTESHISEVALDTFAQMGRFDLTIDTGFHDAETSTALIYKHMRECQLAGEIKGRIGGK